MAEEGTLRFIITTGLSGLALMASGISLWFSLWPYEPEKVSLSPSTYFSPKSCPLKFYPPSERRDLGLVADDKTNGQIELCWTGLLLNVGKSTPVVVETSAITEFIHGRNDEMATRPVYISPGKVTTNEEMAEGAFTVPQFRPVLIRIPIDVNDEVLKAASDLTNNAAGKTLTLADLEDYLENAKNLDLLGNSFKNGGLPSDYNSVIVTLSFKLSPHGETSNGRVKYPDVLMLDDTL